MITLGLGIGATSTIFSAVNSLLLRPLPYQDPNTLMWISNYWPKVHMDRVMSPNLIVARSEARSFAQLAAYTYGDSNLTGGRCDPGYSGKCDRQLPSYAGRGSAGWPDIC